MKITIHSKNLEITSAINDYINKRLSHVEKFLGHNLDVVDAAEFNVDIEKTSNHHKEGEIFLAEVVALVRGRSYTVKAQKEDLYQAIDKVEDELVRVIEHNKERRTSLVRRGGAKLKNLLRGFAGGNKE
jgi:putative sigma-54 modulation protein